MLILIAFSYLINNTNKLFNNHTNSVSKDIIKLRKEIEETNKFYNDFYIDIRDRINDFKHIFETLISKYQVLDNKCNNIVENNVEIRKAILSLKNSIDNSEAVTEGLKNKLDSIIIKLDDIKVYFEEQDSYINDMIKENIKSNNKELVNGISESIKFIPTKDVKLDKSVAEKINEIGSIHKDLVISIRALSNNFVNYKDSNNKVIDKINEEAIAKDSIISTMNVNFEAIEKELNGIEESLRTIVEERKVIKKPRRKSKQIVDSSEENKD